MPRSLLLILLLLGSLGLSQRARAQAGPLRFNAFCSADSMQQEAFRRDPAYRQAYESLLREAARTAASASPEAVPDVTVPMVVHIIYNNAASNISDAQVLDAVNIINEDFQKLSPDLGNIIPAFQPIVADVGFRFRLAQKDPEGNCTTGITRTFSSQTVGATDAVKNLIRWDPSRYLNVWVVTSIGSGAGAYAYLPCPSAALDGIVARSDQFGGIGRSGGSNFARRTMTHELGHYFGLLHAWGPGNTPGAASNCNVDDGVADTPNTTGVPNQSCPLNFAPCGVLANVQNVMDYSSCISMFTNGQRAVMRTSLARTCRANLISAQNLINTGTNDGYVPVPCKPVAAFRIVGPTTVCAGGQISFSDESYNTDLNQAQFQWTLPGATPATASGRFPTVVYSQPGVYDAELRVTNAFGFDTATIKRRIRVIGATQGERAPYAESFEAPSWPFNTTDSNKDWQTSSTALQAVNWTRIDFAGSTGTACLRLSNGALAAGASSTVVTPSINLSQVTGPVQITFDRAYAFKPSGGQETLEVEASVDCGNSWSALAFFDAAALRSTAQTYSSYAVPDPGDWQRLTIPLSSVYLGSPVFQVRLRMTSQGGNTFFLDNFRVGGLQPSRTRSMAERGISVAPNPATAETAVRFRPDQPIAAQVQVLDLLGRPVLTTPAQTYGPGQQRIVLGPAAKRLRPGVYVVQLTLGQDRYTSRIVVE